jgi:hypothetical protein
MMQEGGARPMRFAVGALPGRSRDLLGSMLGEYGLNLQQAKDSVARISDKNVGTEIKQILRSLINSEVPKNSGRSWPASAC